MGQKVHGGNVCLAVRLHEDPSRIIAFQPLCSYREGELAEEWMIQHLQ